VNGDAHVLTEEMKNNFLTFEHFYYHRTINRINNVLLGKNNRLKIGTFSLNACNSFECLRLVKKVTNCKHPQASWLANIYKKRKF